MTPTLILIALLFQLQAILAFTPASPTNSTLDAVGLNATETTQITLQWFSHGSYAQFIVTAARSKDSTGISKGALVHFSEDKANKDTPTTSVPWIAFISCDANSTLASLDTDIFTLAKSKGALAAILYTPYSQTCVLNPELGTASNLDIYVTPTPSSAKLLDYQFQSSQIATQNNPADALVDYDAAKLAKLQADIESSIKQGYAVSGEYLVATISAFNATADAVTEDGKGAGEAGSASNSTAGTESGTAGKNSAPERGRADVVYIVTLFVGAVLAAAVL
ncbi:hypothetical protein DFP72DRAFT_1164203 [Ephemerocybe angulata]|uniref:Uncharacterized protein n=1 Tax=Ephemerocybe angulata TaxID=980116 RepID=A0A8H6MG76_9AGAR|nr:hypothetical protein DFP72DRAFT_1164203 [Tulosesus angulatus]